MRSVFYKTIIFCTVFLTVTTAVPSNAAEITGVDANKKCISFGYNAADDVAALSAMVYTATEADADVDNAVEIDGNYYILDENIAMDQIKTDFGVGSAELIYIRKVDSGDTVVLQLGDDMSSCADFFAANIAGDVDEGVFVAVNGDDSAKGTSDAPVKSVKRAIEVYREAKIEYPDSEISIYVDDGTYPINERIDLTNADDGLTIKNNNGAKVIFTGGYAVSSQAMAVTDNDLNGRLPDDVLDNIFKYDLSNCNLPDKLQIATAYSDTDYQDYVPELIDNGQPMTIARWPNNSWAFTGEIISTNEATQEHEFKTTAPIDGITDFTNARADGFWARDYRLTHAQVLGKGSDTLKIKADAVYGSEWRILPNERYYISNLPEFLDEAGEYYIDYDSKTLYYYPENPDETDLIITGVSEPNGIDSSNKINSIFNIEGASNITIDGIMFENTSGTFISGKNADNIIIKNCVFKNAGGRGIHFRATTNSTVTQSLFSDIGDSSVEFLGCGDIVGLVPSNNRISNCEFKNGARIVGTYAAFVTMGDYEKTDDISIGITAENNYFHNHMHSAVIFGGNDMIIKNNIFDNVVTHTCDSGAVYSNGRSYPYFQGNEITNNIFRNIRSFKQSDADQHTAAVGVYVDDLMSNVVLSENVFYNCEYPTSLAGGIGHTVTNNLVYDCNYGLTYTRRSNLSTSAKAGGDFYSGWQTISSKTGYDATQWYEKYPQYKSLVDALVAYNLDEDDAQYSDRAGYIHDAVFEDNIMVSGNTNLDNTVSGNSDWSNNFFTKLAAYDSASKTGVNEINSYYSADETEIILNGCVLSFGDASSLELRGKELPDIANAGILVQNEIYTMDTGRDNNNEGSGDRGNDFMMGHRSQISDFDLSENVNSMSEGSSVTVRFSQKTNKSFTFAVRFTGNITIALESGTVVSENLESGWYEFDIDMAENNINIYKQNGIMGEWSHIDTKSVVVPEFVYGVNITANSATNIENMAMGVWGEDEIHGYYYLDFEDAKTGEMIDEIDENIFTNNLFAITDASIVEENGNKAFHFSGRNYNSDGTPTAWRDFIKNYLTFTPIKLSGNRVAVEFKVKADSDCSNEYARLLACLIPYGYYEANPDRGIEVWLSDYRINSDGTQGLYMGGSRDGNSLEEATGGTQVATLNELKSGYITFKYILDKDEKTVEVWKKISDIWEKMITSQNYELPDYINRLVSTLFVPYYSEHNTREMVGYTFDDIKIYNADNPFVADVSGEPTEIAAGKTVTLNPDYIPGVRTGNLIGAVYQEDRLVNTDLQPFINGNEDITLTIPDGKSSIKIFRFKSLLSLTPAADNIIIDVE